MTSFVEDVHIDPFSWRNFHILIPCAEDPPAPSSFLLREALGEKEGGRMGGGEGH